MLKNKQSNYKVLYEKYIDQMYSYGRALGVDEDTLYDLIHDVFLHFFEHQNEISEGEHEKYYLLCCLKNRYISQKRKDVDYEELLISDDYNFRISISVKLLSGFFFTSAHKILPKTELGLPITRACSISGI